MFDLITCELRFFKSTCKTYDEKAFNLYLSLDRFSRQQIDALTFHANCLLKRQISSNVKDCFLEKIRKIFQNLVSS